jgi:DnaJ-class molecular chaperone
MTQSDRQIPEKERCTTCSGAGWTWRPGDAAAAQESNWIVCRECIGTGRTDHKGRKRQKPAETPDA